LKGSITINLEKVLLKRENKIIYQYDDTVIKVFDEKYPKSSIFNEALNHARVEETGLKIPKIRSISNIDGRWTICMDYIHGQTLEQKLTENPEKASQLLELFVDLQLEIHSKTAPLLNVLKDKLIRKIQSINDLDATTKYELMTQLDSMPKHTKVCHGDFLPSNIIINDTGAYIIDWSHATQGNASADVATTYLKMLLYYPDLADAYLKLFCKKSNTELQYVQRWFPIVAAQELATANESEKEFLNKWLDVIDYQG
jgi:tRNA A-37 threonylcarbamoyl transferase component Bud32